MRRVLNKNMVLKFFLALPAVVFMCTKSFSFPVRSEEKLSRKFIIPHQHIHIKIFTKISFSPKSDNKILFVKDIQTVKFSYEIHLITSAKIKNWRYMKIYANWIRFLIYRRFILSRHHHWKIRDSASLHSISQNITLEHV